MGFIYRSLFKKYLLLDLRNSDSTTTYISPKIALPLLHEKYLFLKLLLRRFDLRFFLEFHQS